MLLVFNTMNKLRAVYIWYCTFYAIFIVHTLKTFYSEMRLYMQDDVDIKAPMCDTGFGNPGGSVLVMTQLFILLTCDWFKTENIPNDDENSINRI